MLLVCLFTIHVHVCVHVCECFINLHMQAIYVWLVVASALLLFVISAAYFV